FREQQSWPTRQTLSGGGRQPGAGPALDLPPTPVAPLDDQEQVPVDEAGGDAVADPLHSERDPDALGLQLHAHLQTAAQHLLATAGEEAVVAEREGVALDS